MSATSTVVTQRHFDYIRERTIPEDAFLADLKRTAQAAGIPAIWIAPEEAALLRVLLRATGAREVVEVGTLAGYSAIAMARALPPGGRVRTLELLDAHADFAEEWVARSDVAGRVEVLRGDARELLPTFADGSADACFLDADKSGYTTYLRECLRIVRPGGLFLVDNAFAFGQLFDENPTDREAPAVKAFNDHMSAVRELESVIVPMGDGLWVGVSVPERLREGNG